MFRTFKLFLAAVLAVGLSSAVQAATWNFDYQFADGAQLSGMFDATLDGDGDTFTGVTNLMASMNGTDMGITGWSKIGGGQELLSISGATMNIFARNGAFQNFDKFFQFSSLAGYNLNGSSFAHNAAFVASNWSVTPKPPAVPLPASALLLGGGIAGFGLMRAKKKAA